MVKQFSPCACLPPLVNVPPLLLSSICKPPECPKLLLLPPVLLPRPPIVGGLGGRGEAGPLIAFFRKLNRSTIPSLSGLLSLLLKPLITLRISITCDSQTPPSQPKVTHQDPNFKPCHKLANSQHQCSPPGRRPPTDQSAAPHKVQPARGTTERAPATKSHQDRHSDFSKLIFLHTIYSFTCLSYTLKICLQP